MRNHIVTSHARTLPDQKPTYICTRPTVYPIKFENLHNSDGAGVTEEHLDGGGGDGREVEGAQLAHERQMHVHVARLRELAPGLRVDADQLRPLRLDTTR